MLAPAHSGALGLAIGSHACAAPAHNLRAPRDLPPEVKDEKPKKDKAKAAEGRLAYSTGPYVLPPMDLLPARKGDAHTGRPSEAEIREAIASLEATLQSFE